MSSNVPVLGLIAHSRLMLVRRTIILNDKVTQVSYAKASILKWFLLFLVIIGLDVFRFMSKMCDFS